MTLDLSPRALQLFLHGHVSHAGAQAAAISPANRRSGEKAEARRLRKAAGVSQEDFERAWNGMLKAAGPRSALWRALGHDPDRHGISLAGDGKQTPEPSWPDGRAAT